jgi:glutamate--cysteine ligase
VGVPRGFSYVNVGKRHLLSERLDWLHRGGNRKLLQHGLRGIEKEALRVDLSGNLSRRPHPVALGSALTHKSITTDYSEALLELVTPPLPTNWQTLQSLVEIHGFVHRHLDREILWPMSMPCVVNGNEEIPIAQYGSSNLGMLKTVYRRGLGLRYGRTMQAIAGVHFNYSPPAEFWPAYQDCQRIDEPPGEFKSRELMGLIRNYRRNAWLVVYLFGASPAFCKSFRPEGHPLVRELNPSTWYAPFATSLRMSDLGYQNKSQGRVDISANSLADYVRELTRAVSTVEPAYEAIGVCVDGQYRQLNANLLQIENEYYGAIRAKPAKGPKRTVAALRDDGVEYVEVRSLDVSPADPVGVNQTQMRFLEVLLAYCLLAPSPPIDAGEQREIDVRNLLVAQQGRRPKLQIPMTSGTRSIIKAGARVMEDLEAVSSLFDDEQNQYRESVRSQSEALEDPSRTPSARLLADLEASNAGFFDYSLEIARAHHDYFLSLPMDSATTARFTEQAAQSLNDTELLEADRSATFEDFLSQFDEEL